MECLQISEESYQTDRRIIWGRLKSTDNQEIKTTKQSHESKYQEGLPYHGVYFQKNPRLGIVKAE